MKNWISFAIKMRYYVLIVCTIITLAMLFSARRLTMLINIDELVPQSHPYIVTNNKAEAVFGAKYLLVIGVTAKHGTVFNQAILEKVKLLTDKVVEIPGIMRSNVVSLSSPKAKSIEGNSEGMIVSRIMENVPSTPEEMIKLEAALRNNPVYENLIISKDHKTTVVVAEMNSSKDTISKIVNKVDEVARSVGDDTVKITVGGGGVFTAMADKYAKRAGLLFLIAFVIVGLIHYEAFRTLQSLFLPLVTSLLAVIWALGCLTLMGQPMDVFNSATPILILAVAAGHAVQILKRYYEEFAKLRLIHPEMPPKELNQLAVLTSLSAVGPVMTTAGIIAAVGFFSLAIFEIKSIKTFGIFTGSGIVSALILELSFIPALRSLLRAPSDRELQREQKRTIWDRIIQTFYGWTTTHVKKVFLYTFAIVTVLGFGGLLLKVDSTQRLYYDKSSVGRMDDSWLNEQMGGTSSLFVMLEGDKEDAIKNPEILKAMDRIQSEISKHSEIGKSVSLVDFIKQMNQAMNGGNPKYYSVPDSQDLIAQYLLIYSSSGEPGDFDRYVDQGYRQALIQFYSKSDGANFVTALLKEVQDYARQQLPSSIKVSVGGGTATGVAINDVMVKEKALNILQIMAAVLIISSLVFRSVTAGLLILLPLVATVIANFGIMGYLGIPLQLGTALVSAMAVGVGADYGIYMCFRMREELRSGLAPDQALRKAYFSAGKAVLFVSSAIAGGFGVMMLSRGFLPHIWLGLLIGLATVVSSFTSLTLLPALIFHFKPNFIFKN